MLQLKEGKVCQLKEGKVCEVKKKVRCLKLGGEVSPFSPHLKKNHL